MTAQHAYNGLVRCLIVCSHSTTHSDLYFFTSVFPLNDTFGLVLFYKCVPTQRHIRTCTFLHIVEQLLNSISLFLSFYRIPLGDLCCIPWKT